MVTALIAFHISDIDKFPQNQLYCPNQKIFEICIKNFNVLCYSAPGLRFSEKLPGPLTRDTHLSYLVPAGTSPVYLFVYVLPNTVSFLQTFLYK